MKKSNSTQKALGAFKKLGAVALITATMFFVACKQTSGGGGGEKPTPTPTPTKYTVTLNQAEHGKVTASPEIPANKLVVKDTVITFTATANAGYKVGKWKVTPAEALQAGTGVDGSPTAKVKITANTTVSVSFEAIPKHVITFSVDGANGTLTAKVDGGEITSGKEVEEGKTVTFTATANDGYRVKGWTLDGSAVNGTNNSYSFPVTKACTVKVSFEDASTPLPKHKITFSVEGANGTLKAKADGIDETETSPITVEEGKTVTFTAEPSTNYKVKEWKVGDTVVAGNKTNTYSHTVTKAVTVKVSFEDNSTPLPKHKITFSVEGENGTLKAKADGIDETSTSPINVEEGKTVTFTAEPNTNYKVKEWKVGDTVVTGNKTTTYTHTVKKAVTVKVSFEAKSNPPTPQTKYTVTLNQAEHGTVTASPAIPTDKQVAKDTEITFTAKANDGYRVNTWTVSPSSAIQSGGGKGETTAKLKITADTTVSVSFEAIPPTKYTVTLNQTEHGTVTALPAIPADKLVDKDTVITFTAKANEGYRVNTWTVSPSSAIQSGGNKGEATAKVKITADTQVSVSFEAIPKHAITFGVEGGGTLKAKADGIDETSTSPINVEEGKTITFTATPSTGYWIKEWKVDGTAIKGNTSNIYTHTVAKAVNVTVSFKPLVSGKAILTPDPSKLTIKVWAKTADDKPIEVEGCNEATLESGVETYLHAKGTTVILKGNITELDCYGNHLTALSVQGLTALQKLNCAWIGLTALDVQGCTALQELNCKWNSKLTALNVQGLNALQKLNCSGDKLTALDVSGLTSLQELYCSGNNFTALDVSGLTSLKELSCGNNDLTELNVQGLTALKELNCQESKLTSLNVQGCTSLQELNCNKNKLTELNVQGLSALQKLDCSSCNLTALDVSGLTSLQELFCHGGTIIGWNGKLTTLNLHGCTSLKELDCQGNKLTVLDVSDLTALQKLYCYNNLLTAFDVHGLTALHTLDCYNNQLKSLNVSGCTALRTLTCYANQINAQSMTELLKALPASEADDDAVALLYTEKTKTGVTEDNCKDFGQPAELKTAFDGAKGRNWTLKKINKSGKWEEI